MESQRNLLVIGLLVVSFLLWQQWNADKAPKPQTVAVTQTDSSVPAASNATDVPGEKAQTSTRKLIKLSSDQLELLVDTQGGDIVDAKLLQLPQVSCFDVGRREERLQGRQAARRTDIGCRA